MRRKELGRTGLKVTDLCLGTMTWGNQNTEAEGHAQIDMALDHGINFIDTAEAYPVNPVRDETAGRTESILGSWFAASGRRHEVVLATKMSGQGSPVRGGPPISSETLREALEGSLRRLGTDYIDLYQLHWPNRGSYNFRKNWDYDPSGQDRAETVAHMEDVLDAMGRLVAAGKVRHFGLSNETTWGVAQWLRIAETRGWPRVASVQNEYSFLCRMADTDMAELLVNEEVGFMAFSPVAGGLLSGKYAGDVTPEGSRRSFAPDMGGRITPGVWQAVSAYLGIAAEHRLDPCQMALAFVRSRPFVTSALVGATSTAQLQNALGAATLELSPQALADIAAAHRVYPMPF